jgi:hypothetical protein
VLSLLVWVGVMNLNKQLTIGNFPRDGMDQSSFYGTFENIGSSLCG